MIRKPPHHLKLILAMGAWTKNPTSESRANFESAIKRLAYDVHSYLIDRSTWTDDLPLLKADITLLREALIILENNTPKEQENESNTSEAEEVDSQEERQSVSEGRDGTSHEQVSVPHLHWEDSEVIYPKHNPETDGCGEDRVKIKKPLFYYDQTACFIRPGDYVDIGKVPYLVVVVSLMIENLVELTMDTSETTEDACTVATLIVHNDQVLKIARDTPPRKM